MSPEELYMKHEYLCEKTLMKMYPFAKGIAQSHRIEVDDLLQYARTGLFIACKKFDKSKGIKFKNFAINNIRWHVTERLNRECNMFKITVNTHNWEKEMYQITSMDRVIGDSEVADTLHDITPSDINVENEAIGNLKEEYLYSCLSERQLEIIKLIKKELSFSEIGRLQNCTGTNVKYHYEKAKEKMERLREEVI